MKIIIIGCGKIGTRILETLSKEGHNIIVIDNKNNTVQDIVERFDVMGVCGNGASLSILEEAGAKGSDLVIATTESDELNILACLCAKRLGAKQTIARVREPEYIQQSKMMKEDLGLSMIVNPEADAAEEIENIISVPSIVKIEHFGKNKVNLFEIKVDENSILANKTLIDLGRICKTKVLICIIVRGDEVIIPNGRSEILAGDHLYITSDNENLLLFLNEINLYKKPIKNAMIVGGGRISHYLIDSLLKKHINVKAIEKNKEKSEDLARSFPKAEIINADGSNQDLLIEEGIENVDAYIALTGVDEENIITSMYANQFNIYKVITKLKKKNFGNMINDLGIASVVNPTDIAADKVTSYIRALQNKRGSNITTLYKLVGEKIEAIEFEAKHDEKFYSIPLNQLKIKDTCIIAAIIRNGEVIIPCGSDTIEIMDNVIVISADNSLNDLSDIIK